MVRRLLLFLFIVSSCLISSAQPVTQTAARRITLHLTHATLRKIIDTLESTGWIQIDYPGKAELYRDIDCRVDNATLEETMKTVLQGLSFNCVIYNRNGIETAVLSALHTLKLTGRLLDDLKQPVDDAEIRVKGGHSWVNSDAGGNFHLDHVPDSALLLITGAGIRPREEPVRGRTKMIIQLSRRIKNLPSAVVSYDDGLRQLRPTFTSGSYSVQEEADIDKVISRDLYAHIGLMPGITPGAPGNVSGFSIRGRNTILSGSAPLLVFDYFPYPGRMDDINFNDLRSITVLKDAAAAGIYGAYSGNGAIVLSSKEGQYNTPRSFSFTMNTTLTEKPRLSAQHRLSTAGYLLADSLLVNSGYYDGALNDPTQAINPAIPLFWRKQNGGFSPVDAAALDNLRDNNLSRDLGRYYYRRNLSQQLHLGIEGGCNASKYYFGLGYDHDPTPLVRNEFQRVTGHGAYTVRPGLRNLEIALSFNLAVVNTRNNNIGNIPVFYPFAALADRAGRPLAVAYQYNPAFVDTATGAYPLDWHYRPLQELALANDRSGRVNGHLQLGLTYKLPPFFTLELRGRWMKGHSYENELHDVNSFFVRDLVNTYAQQKANGQGFYYPVPIGAILVRADTGYTAYNARAQLHFEKETRAGDQWSAYAGAAIDGSGTNGQTQRIYGHNNPVGNARMDLTGLFPTPFGGDQTIPTDNGFLELANRAVSIFTSAYYSLHRDFTFYGAFRMDASNFVGVGNDRRWGPFWSGGVSHNIVPADSAHPWKPAIKLRLSYGCNGGVSNRTGYLITQSLDENAYHVQQSGILSPPDPSLGWEGIYILNAGTDFSLFRDSLSRHGRLSGSIDIFQKRCVNLLAVDTLTPSAGVAAFTGNTAGIKGYGFELALTSVNLRGKFKWTTTIVVSYVNDWISKLRFQPVSPSSYVSGGFERRGKSPVALITYKWAGLDSAGNPRGYVKGTPSTDYNGVMNSADGAWVDNGSRLPVLFGSLTNSFSLGAFTLTARLVVKTGYSFLRPSIDYGALARGAPGHSDFERRWKKPGDEAHTSVPSFVLPDVNRDLFYLNSSALATRGDQLRWQDCYLSYDILPRRKPGAAASRRGALPFKQVTVYTYINNIGLLWRANKNGIDPDAPGAGGDLPTPRSWSLGANFKF